MFLIVAPALIATVGYVLLFNFRGAADYVYLRILQKLSADVPFGALKVFAAFAAFMGTVGFVAEM
ncbi:hypothetical protein RM572_03375 [Streptomyces sp. DSM 42041]|uniref:Uncharacterized protein n=1 Tax=Streptomyces hazeniae TaxID=3075538 RepID=A0ABU2NLG4_9ACTN|nr:hypothetical protein [Streptomyces sp. DSM 42041]MDT0377814.1 hypothetical protein [Streptomyces sp. DSM 42041]